MASSFNALFSFCLVVAAGLPAACSNGDGREQTGGTQATMTGGETDTATGSNSSAGTDTAVGEGDQGQASASIPNGKSLEQCTREGKAWRAVVDGGKAPATCTDPLVAWCCTRSEITTRFAAMASLLEGKFKQFVDSEGYVLYHCSQNAAEKKFTFHMGKMGDGSTAYKTVYVTDVFPTGENTKSADCKQVTTADLQAAGSGTGSQVATGTASTAAFTALKPVLAAKCGGSNCHDDGGTQPVSSQWLNDETKFKASDSLARVQASTNPMPPTAQPALTVEEKAKLLEFLTP